jgi:hypothetical protein
VPAAVSSLFWARASSARTPLVFSLRWFYVNMCTIAMFKGNWSWTNDGMGPKAWNGPRSLYDQDAILFIKVITFILQHDRRFVLIPGNFETFPHNCLFIVGCGLIQTTSNGSLGSPRVLIPLACQLSE